MDRDVTPEDLPGLSPTAVDFFTTVRAFIDPRCRGPEADVRAALARHGFSAHEPALAFDRTFAGLWHYVTAFEPPPIAIPLRNVEWAVSLGIIACLEGRFREAFDRARPFVDEGESPRDVERERELTPIGYVAGAGALALYMDGDGAVWWYSGETRSWGKAAESGIAYVERHAQFNAR